MRISDWSSDVCSSDLWTPFHAALLVHFFVYGDIKAERRTQFQYYMSAIHRGVPMADAAEVFGDMRKLQFAIGAYIVRRSRRSDERRVGKECVSTFRYRWSPYHYKKKEKYNKDK